jgi:hypothetical protein
MSLLGAEAADRSAVILGHLNWLIALGRHDIRHHVLLVLCSALSRCSCSSNGVPPPPPPERSPAATMEVFWTAAAPPHDAALDAPLLLLLLLLHLLHNNNNNNNNNTIDAPSCLPSSCCLLLLLFPTTIMGYEYLATATRSGCIAHNCPATRLAHETTRPSLLGPCIQLCRGDRDNHFFFNGSHFVACVFYDTSYIDKMGKQCKSLCSDGGLDETKSSPKRSEIFLRSTILL